jgi:photosystem II stability/assembly factor-like uncharacterized protein
MKADLSRNSFDSAQHFSAVRLQQGRIVTDADWNEQADIVRHHAERQARDTIGPSGAPLDGAGYRIVAETNALAVKALSANVAWIVGEDGVLLATANGGTNWTLINLASARHLRAIATAGAAGWVVGDGGVVRKTSDAGLNWSSQQAGTVRNLRGVDAVDADHAWTVGDDGIILSTSNGGASWTLVRTDAARLYAVRFSDALNGVAVGRGGVILRTSDGGDSWSGVASGTTDHLRALARVGATRYWVAGQGGTILRSSDGGVTWQPGGVTWLPGATPSAVTLHAIAFRDEREGWAVGENGTVLHSTDAGATWVQEDSGLGAASLRGLAIFGSDPGWVVGEGVGAFRVTVASPALTSVPLPTVNLSIQPGRYYVNGVLCELEARCSYAQQADGGAGERLEPGAYLLYLDAWHRHISALEAPAIREVALGGPDTATRSRTVAQVRALPLPAQSPFEWNCDSNIQAWDALMQRPRPRLAARAKPQLAAANLCEIASTAGYRRLENQLYRVEIHDGGQNPTFKWSRENGSVAYAVVSVTIDSVTQRTIVRVAARGRDANLDLAVHDRVELIDDAAELTKRSGTLFEYVADGDDELELVLAGVPANALGQDASLYPVLRRWDHKPTAVGANALPIVQGTWIDLEDGVQVRFEPGGAYRPGDYWQIPARTMTADIDWPRDDDGDPFAREPAGIVDSYCRLGIVEVDPDGVVTVASDCRELFPPLTELKQLHYVSGDGQDAAPNALLPQPLALHVLRGTVPVVGAGVRFEVDSGGGLVGDGLRESPVVYETTTDPTGLAGCRWRLGPGIAAPDRYQRVRASLFDADSQPLPGQTIVYCATATGVLQYVGGDGQQAGPAAPLPCPLEFRVANGGDGVQGVVLSATVEQGGGTVIGAANVTTDLDGYASVGWQLGISGLQRLSVRLQDAQGNELQRLSYSATVVEAANGGGGCAITIGAGGQFERLDSDLLERLLEERKGRLCLCFMPGFHDLDGLEVKGRGERLLSLHGCGPSAVLQVRGNIILSEFAAIELRDLVFTMSPDNFLALFANAEVQMEGISLSRVDGADQPLLFVEDLRVVRMSRCTLGQTRPASAVFQNIQNECRIEGCRFDGPISFYGLPGENPAPDLIEALSNAQPTELNASSSRLFLVDNSVQQLTIGAEVARQLVLKRSAENIFQTAVLQGNTFSLQSNVFVSPLLSFGGNSFIAEPTDNDAPYGVMVATRAAAAGNVAVRFGDEAILHFLIPGEGGFSGAANQVFTVPRSRP